MTTLEEKILSLEKELNREDGATPLYTQLADLIKLVIKNGGHKGGEKLPTERLMSETFNLSRGTVRKTLDELLEEKIVEKIQGKGIFLSENYVPKLPKLNIGILYINGLFDTSHPMYAEHFKGIESVLKNYDYTLNYIGVDKKLNKEKLRKDIKDNNLNGFISFILENNLTKEISKVIKDNVFVSKLESNKSAYIDFAKVLNLQVEYLYKMGHRNIAFNYCSMETEHTQIMYNEYMSFCENYNLKPYLFEIDTYSMETGKHLIKDIVKDKNISAIISADDFVAMGMLSGLNDLNLKCPDDISIVGMGDYNICPYTIPSLTTIYLPYFEVGVNLAKSLINKKQNENLQPVFVERNSVKNIN